jgi:hypothetical protein
MTMTAPSATPASIIAPLDIGCCFPQTASASYQSNLYLSQYSICCNIALGGIYTMANRLLSIIVAAYVMCFALALRAQRKTQVALARAEYDIRKEVNVPGYSFSRN